MSYCKRTKLLLLVLCTLKICWCELTHDICQQLQGKPNITCTEEENQTIIIFDNEEHFKIYISEYKSVTISCLGTDEDVLQISANLAQLHLGQLNDLTIDGCFPFTAIMERLGISTGATLWLRQGVTNMPLKRSHLANLNGINHLSLSGFSQLDAELLTDMQDIEVIDLNRMAGVLPDRLLAPISARLSELHMWYAGMKTPPAELFAPLQRLGMLDLRFNEWNTIPSGTFEQLHNLTVLDLSNNQLTQLPADVFRPLRQLLQLYLANNHLKQLEIGTFTTLNNLQHLDLENNALEFETSVACSIFDGLNNLEWLVLNNNSLSVYCLPIKMKSVSVKLLNNRISALLVSDGERQPRSLVDLNVHNNRLQHLSDDVLQYLHDTSTELHMADNPWQCDCESVMLLNFLKLNKKNVNDLVKMRCADGRLVEAVTQLPSSEMCKPALQWYCILAVAIMATLVLCVVLEIVRRKVCKRYANKRSAYR